APARRAGQLFGSGAENAVLERPESQRDYRGAASSASSQTRGASTAPAGVLRPNGDWRYGRVSEWRKGSPERVSCRRTGGALHAGRIQQQDHHFRMEGQNSGISVVGIEAQGTYRGAAGVR